MSEEIDSIPIVQAKNFTGAEGVLCLAHARDLLQVIQILSSPEQKEAMQAVSQMVCKALTRYEEDIKEMEAAGQLQFTEISSLGAELVRVNAQLEVEKAAVAEYGKELEEYKLHSESLRRMIDSHVKRCEQLLEQRNLEETWKNNERKRADSASEYSSLLYKYVVLIRQWAATRKLRLPKPPEGLR